MKFIVFRLENILSARRHPGKTRRSFRALKNQSSETRKSPSRTACLFVRRKIRSNPEILYGNVAATILEYAEKNAANMIVVGAKGRGALEELLMGSVTQKVLTHSSVPVLVIRGED